MKQLLLLFVHLVFSADLTALTDTSNEVLGDDSSREALNTNALDAPDDDSLGAFLDPADLADPDVVAVLEAVRRISLTNQEAISPLSNGHSMSKRSAEPRPTFGLICRLLFGDRCFRRHHYRRTYYNPGYHHSNGYNNHRYYDHDSDEDADDHTTHRTHHTTHHTTHRTPHTTHTTPHTTQRPTQSPTRPPFTTLRPTQSPTRPPFRP